MDLLSDLHTIFHERATKAVNNFTTKMLQGCRYKAPNHIRRGYRSETILKRWRTCLHKGSTQANVWTSTILPCGLDCSRRDTCTTYYCRGLGCAVVEFWCAVVELGCAVVEWWRSWSDCELRGSNPGQGRHLKRDFCFIRIPAVVKACHTCRVRP